MNRSNTKSQTQKGSTPPAPTQRTKEDGCAGGGLLMGAEGGIPSGPKLCSPPLPNPHLPSPTSPHCPPTQRRRRLYVPKKPRMYIRGSANFHVARDVATVAGGIRGEVGVGWRRFGGGGANRLGPYGVRPASSISNPPPAKPSFVFFRVGAGGVLPFCICDFVVNRFIGPAAISGEAGYDRSATSSGIMRKWVSKAMSLVSISSAEKSSICTPLTWRMR